ncbi:MAG: ABC transporter substrate-binding protein [Acidimicrobiales bacterium]
MKGRREIDRRSFLSRSAVTGGAVALGAAAPAALAGCSSSSSGSPTTSSGSKPGVGSGNPVRGGSLTVAVLADIDGFYPPTNHWDTNGFNYANAIYDPLMAVAADGTIQGYLAQSMTPNSTFDTWTMTLRSGIKFHDGSDLTAAVVKANYDALLTSALTGPALKQVTSVTATGDLTVVFALEAPNPLFPAGLTTQVGYVVAESMIHQAQSNPNSAPTPVGTGPFVFDQWQPNSSFSATRNPNYWRSGLPYLEQITFKPIPDTTQREATLRSGGVDMIQSTDPNTIVRFSGSGGSGFQVVDSVTGVIGEPTVAFIMLNCETAPTNDLRIRQALAKATDTAEIRKIYDAGFGGPINGLFLSNSPYYSNTGFPTYDPTAARQLINEYKAEHGTPSLKLITIPDPLYIKLIQIIQQMWEQVGVTVTLGEVEQATIITDFITGEFQAATVYQFGAVDPDLNYVWFSSTTVSPVGSIGLNFPRNSDPQIESALLTGRHTTDQAARNKAYQTVNERLAVDLPYIWLSQYFFSEVAENRVQNFANPTLPNGSPGYAFDEGIFFPTQIWMAG